MNKYICILLLTILISACATPRNTEPRFNDKYAKIQPLDPVEVKKYTKEIEEIINSDPEYLAGTLTPVYEMMWVIHKDRVKLSKKDIRSFNLAFETFIDAFNHVETKGLPEAVDVFQRLAEKGSSISQHMVGAMSLRGIGMVQDFTKAHMWLNIAASQGHRTSAAWLDLLDEDLSAEQLVQAQKLARECVAKDYKGC